MRPSGVASHEPMEVDHNRSHQRCFNCNKFGHKIKDCRVKVKQVNASDQYKPKNQIVLEMWGKKATPREIVA